MPQADNLPTKPVADSHFEQISKALEIEVQKQDWASRPRTYFILWQIKRIDAMNAFIVQGLNDTSFPYSGRDALPDTLTYFEASDFLKWQIFVYNDILHLEQGTTHCQLADGDVLFERKPVQLGVGSQGSTVVDKVISKRTGKVYARKRIRKKMFGFDTKALKTYENELKALKKIADNHHLIKVRGTYTDRKYLVMLLEPVADENLKEYMNRGGPRTAEEQKQFRTYFGCLAHTIRFLHAADIEVLHKDIKPENILIRRGHVILTDFGTAFDWSKSGQSMTRSNAGDVRTPRYQSPEVAGGEFHRSSDIWSLGVVFLEMVTILRGKTLREMDEYLTTHGNCVIPIHQNLDAAMEWFEPLQEHQEGSQIDNEPLIWIHAILNHGQFNRPTADDLYDMIVAFGRQFCGSCCLETDSDSDDDYDNYDDDDGKSEATVLASGFETRYQLSIPCLQQGTSHSKASDQEDQSDDLPRIFPASEGSVGEEYVLDPIPLSEALARRNTDVQQASKIERLPQAGVGKGHGHRRSSRGGLKTSSARQDASRGQGHSQTTPLTKGHMSTSKTSGVRIKLDPFPDRGFFKSWLAALPAKFATSSFQARSRSRKGSGGRAVHGPSIRTQRMRHFLSSLPEEPTDFEYVHGGFSAFQQPTPPLGSSSADVAIPILSNIPLERSKSFENLPTSSSLLEEEAEDCQFSDIPKSKLVHSASESNLNLDLELSKEDLQEVTSELKGFKTVIPSLVKETPPEAVAAPLANAPEPAVDHAAVVEPIPQVPTELLLATSRVDQLLQDSRSESTGQPGLALSAPMPGAGTTKETASPDSATSDFQDSIILLSSPSPKVAPNPQPGSLGSFIARVPAIKQRNWESASVIMKRIMNDKSSVAPTSEISAKTRLLVSNGRIVTRWNDHSYNWLPNLVARGRVGGVRELLKAGCNPGTLEKPRWSPVYNAIMGRTEQHTRCLRALAAYGANMNAALRSNGRTFLHYAIEQKLWSGYSTVIYVLLIAGADPNARDKAGNLPLLMLLVGNGPLPQEKRDALYLLLAPNFTSNLDVSLAGTLDNPLHLAIRRKDAYTVDALLTKIVDVSGHMRPMDGSCISRTRVVSHPSC